MIKRYFKTDYPRLCATCDSVNLPFYGYDKDFLCRCSYPFLYGKSPRSNKDFVLLGNRGGAHDEILHEFYTELHCMGCGNRSNFLCARIYENDTARKGMPKGFFVAWEDEGPGEYFSSKSIGRIIELLKKQGIDISNKSIITEQPQEEKIFAVYEINVCDYARLNLSSFREIPAEYERQERKRGSSVSADKWKQFDDGNGNGYLGYHLLAYMDENKKEINDKGMNKKQTIRLNESQLQYIIGESIKKILSESFDNSEKTLYAYDCDNPNGYKVIHTVNGTDFREIKAYIQKFLSEQIDWMDDEHLNDKDIDGAITNIAKSLVKKGESGFIYTYCFYLGNDVPKNN